MDTGGMIRELYEEAGRGGVHRLTRKYLNRDQVQAILKPGHFQDGDTGTVYLGERGKAEAYMKIYDKRQEVFDRTGEDMGGDVLRYELTVTGKLGPTLKDAFDPTDLFWHFVGRTVLKSEGVPLPEWVGHSEGYILPARKETLPYQALVNRIEGSAELRDLAALAAQCGKVGEHCLVSRLRELVSQSNTVSRVAEEVRLSGDASA